MSLLVTYFFVTQLFGGARKMSKFEQACAPSVFLFSDTERYTSLFFAYLFFVVLFFGIDDAISLKRRSFAIRVGM